MIRTLRPFILKAALPAFACAPLTLRAQITSPLDIPGHVLWLDGDDLDGDGNVDAAVTGTAVTAWADKSSGMGTTSASRTNGNPLRAASVRAGHHAVKFIGGSQDKLDIPALSLSAGYTVVVVAEKSGSFGDSGHMLSGLNASGTDCVLYRQGGGSCRFYSGGPTGNTDLALGTMAAGAWTMAGVQISPSGQDFGLLQSARTAMEWNGTAALQGVRIGNLDRDTPSSTNRAEAWDGHIGEVIIYDRVLTAAEVTDLRRWLNTKYAIVIAEPTGAMTQIETGHVSGGAPSTLLNTSEPVSSGRVNVALATRGGTAFAQDFIGPADPRNFRPFRANDGHYADAPEGAPPIQEPWIGATLSSFVGVRFSAPVTLDRVGFENQFGARRSGQLIFEYTRDDLSAVPAHVNLGLDPAVINSKAWLPLDLLQIADAVDTRHLYSFAPLTAVTGLRVRINSSAAEFAMSELEAWSAVPPAVSYPGSPAAFTVQLPAGPLDPALQGATPASFSIAPALPQGLTFSTSSGRIAGTPTVLSAATDYTVTASYSGGTQLNATVNIAVVAPSLAGYTRSPATFTRGRLAVPVDPVVLGPLPTGYTVSPPLPAGLSLAPTTGVISGTPLVAAAATPYAVTASFTGYPGSTFNLTIEVIEPAWTLDITEVMSANDTILADGDGRFSDWIELHNYGPAAIDLSDWSLTDSEGSPRKYVFPPRLIEPGGYLVVFASNNEHVDPAGNLHTNFALSASGEYCALIRPDGVVVRAMTLPAMTADISHGTPDRVNYGTYTSPTPGAANGFFNAVSAVVTATPPAQAFAGTVTVALSAALPAGGVIRYTTNGSAPVVASPAYSSALSFSVTTKLRARVFAPGLDPGPELRADYLKLAADLAGFSSNLPLVLLHTDGAIAGASSTTLTGAGGHFISADAGTGRAAAAGLPAHSGRVGLRLRGRSSLSFPQKQYKLETWDSTGREVNAPLLGMAASSDWVLSSPYTDKSLMRNALTYLMWGRMGWPTLNWRFVEVFINDDGDSQFSYADDYVGVYLLVEPPDLDRAEEDGPQNTTDAAQITGGFMVETGPSDDAEFYTTGSGRQVGHKHRDPGLNKLNAAQNGWIRTYASDFESALYGANFVHPSNGRNWRSYTNIASQVDYRIAREWARNFDGGSTYWHVPRGGQLTMGPLWDYNWALGNVNYAEGGDLPGHRTDGWNRSFTNFGTWAPWWLRMEQEADWWQQFIDRWSVLRETVLADTAVNAEIDAIAAMLGAEAAKRNFAKWPQLGRLTVISPPGYAARTTYQSEVDYLKTWLQQRSAWMESQFPPRPAFSPAPGGVSAGSSVTLTAAAGQTIHYMLNGEDPRLPGGAVNPAALSVSSGGSVTVSTSAIVTARAKNGAVWGAPRTGAYVTGIPAAPASLVLTEIHYHPADPASPAELAAIPALSDDDFEFLELRNVSAGPLDLSGATFTEGVHFTFPAGTVLAAGAHIVVVENATAFALRYGNGATIAGQFTGNLDNDADTIVLRAVDGMELLRCRYDEDWTARADGAGHSLNLRDPSQPPAAWSRAASWALSASTAGSPGAGNGPVFTDDFTLWRHTHFSATALGDPLLSGPAADPDEDGWPNLTEFGLTSLPHSSASPQPPAHVITASEVEFTITRPRLAPGLTWGIESSGDLAAWTAAAMVEELISQTDATRTVRLRTPHAGPARQYWRLRAVLAP